MDFATEPVATSPEDVRARHQANALAWNQAAVRYTEGQETAIASLRAGESSVHPLERAAIGELLPTMRRAVHLQCASGRDTISLLLEGVDEVVGIDISSVHIDNARATAQALGAHATFHCSDVLDTPHELDGTADLVYTGRGALCWLHDLRAWAVVIARLLAPGGVLCLLDDHPVTALFAQDTRDLTPTGADYFAHAEVAHGWGPNYIGELDEAPLTKHERLWTISDLVTALLDAGLLLRRLEEHREGYWNRFPELDPAQLATIPLTLLVVAQKPRQG